MNRHLREALHDLNPQHRPSRALWPWAEIALALTCALIGVVS
jgi:hypothetical protein